LNMIDFRGYFREPSDQENVAFAATADSSFEMDWPSRLVS
jgi:hypothetical protein